MVYNVMPNKEAQCVWWLHMPYILLLLSLDPFVCMACGSGHF